VRCQLTVMAWSRMSPNCSRLTRFQLISSSLICPVFSVSVIHLRFVIKETAQLSLCQIWFLLYSVCLVQYKRRYGSNEVDCTTSTGSGVGQKQMETSSSSLIIIEMMEENRRRYSVWLSVLKSVSLDIFS